MGHHLAFTLGSQPAVQWHPLFQHRLADYLGADRNEYTAQVMRVSLVCAIGRAVVGGTKFDYVPILVGTQGIGKSTFLARLGKQWFSDTHFDVGRGKDGQEQVQGLWVYEIAELAAFSKSDINLIKAFISAEVDRYRPSYGRVVEAYQRQCVLGGTTNEKQWLRDRTGNRRWWPVPVKNRVKIEWLQKYRDQLPGQVDLRLGSR